jgi:hypothetical protein
MIDRFVCHLPRCAGARATSLFALVALLALSGCGITSSLFGSSSKGSSGHGPAAVFSACPNVVILRPLANTAVFAPSPEHRPENVAFYGILSDVSAKCDTLAGAVLVRLSVILVAQRGPATSGNGVDLDYFVAVTGADQQIISKRPFAVHVTFPTADKARAGVTDHIVEAIPLSGHQPGQYNMVLGFQQSPDVVDFYKHFRGRP